MRATRLRYALTKLGTRDVIRTRIRLATSTVSNVIPYTPWGDRILSGLRPKPIRFLRNCAVVTCFFLHRTAGLCYTGNAYGGALDQPKLWMTGATCVQGDLNPCFPLHLVAVEGIEPSTSCL